jgi:hypothetical protein
MILSSIPASCRRYVLRETLMGFGFNGALSALFAWLPFHGLDSVPLWGARGMAVDLVPTVFMITLVQTLILTALTRRRVRSRAIIPIEHGAAAPLFLQLPGNSVLRAAMMASTLTVVLVPATIGVLAAAGVDELAIAPFMAFKVIYGIAVGALSAPVVLLAALLEPAEQDS